MSRNAFANRSLRSVLLLGGASIATMGFAAQALAQDTGTETVVVTGSRIPQQGLYSTSPVTAVGQQEFKLQGSTSVGQTLRSLPSTVEDGDGNTVDNGTAGIATIDLRNLGPKRTLVLVDGKRLTPSDALGDVDTNQIPSQMVDHIEVLTGGASAIYGSDAVSGVVNIILRKDFQGMEVDGQYSETDHGDGSIVDTSGVLGFNSGDGKGNVTIYGEYNHRAAIPESDRAYSAHALASNNFTGCAPTAPQTHFGGFCFGGSPTIPQGRVKSPGLGGTDPNGGGSLLNQSTLFTPSGQLTAYKGQTFNFAPYQFYQSEGTRYAFGAEGHYDVNSHLNFYTRLTFSDNQSTSQLGPSPLSRNFDINCGNPLMSPQEREVIFGTTTLAGTIASQCASAGDTPATQRLLSLALRLTSVGPRVTDEDHTAYQMVFGFRGDLAWGWTYDVSGSYGHTLESRHLNNDALAGNFQDGLLVDPSGVCESGNPACVPINFFSAGGITPAQAAFIRSDLEATAKTDHMELEGDVSGDLGAIGGKSPWAKDPIGIAAGVDYRQESAAFEPDNNLATNNLVGFQASPPVHGRYDVQEGYTEVRLPVVENMPFFQLLQFEGAYRYSSYDRSGGVSTYKYGGEWSPVDDVRLRASYERAIRAPNISELFGAAAQGAFPGPDPCSAAGHTGSSAIPTTAALCVATGANPGNIYGATFNFPGALNCPTNQCEANAGGNPSLKPEISDTRTVGIVLTPTFLDGFSATVDYYNIRISGFINAIPLTTILTNCYDPAVNTSQSAASPFCAAVHRDTLGQIDTNVGFVNATSGNFAFDQVKGFDFDVNYQTDLANLGWTGAGSIGVQFQGTLVTSNNFQPVKGAPINKCAGLFGPTCGEPENKFKSNMRVTWYSPSDDVSLSLRWRHLSSANLDAIVLAGAPFSSDPVGSQIPAYNYFDLSGTWAVTDGIELRAGVSNIFNKNPPLIDNNSAPVNDVNGNTFPNTYDALGRVIFVGGTVKF